MLYRFEYSTTFKIGNTKKIQCLDYKLAYVLVVKNLRGENDREKTSREKMDIAKKIAREKKNWRTPISLYV